MALCLGLLMTDVGLMFGGTLPVGLMFFAAIPLFLSVVGTAVWVMVLAARYKLFRWDKP